MVRGGGAVYSLLISVVHVFAVVLHVIVNRLLLTEFNFPYAVTLTVLQYLSISISLSFWAIFGIVRLRRIPINGSIRLAVGAAICSALSNLSLRFNSLASFQAARLTAGPAVLLVQYILGGDNQQISDSTPQRPITAFITGFFVCVTAIGVFIFDRTTSRIGITYAIIGVLATALYQVLSFRLRITTKANELQLQLVTKTLGALFLAFIAPFLDDYRVNSDTSILDLDLDESVGLMLLLSAFLAFLSFVAQRASVARRQTRAYNKLAYTVSILIFVSHFVLNGFRDDSIRQLPLIIAVMLATVLFAHARDGALYRRVAITDNSSSAMAPLTAVSRRGRPAIIWALERAARNPASTVRRQKMEVRPRERDMVRLNTFERGRQRSIGAASSSRPSQSEPDLLQRINEV